MSFSLFLSLALGLWSHWSPSFLFWIWYFPRLLLLLLLGISSSLLLPLSLYSFPYPLLLFPCFYFCSLTLSHVFPFLCAECTSQSPSFLYLSFRLWVATPRYHKYIVLATQNGKGTQSGPSPQFSSSQFPLSLSSQFWSFGVLFSFGILLVLSKSCSGCLLGLSYLWRSSYPFLWTCWNSSKTCQQIFEEGVLLCTTGSNPLSLCCLPLPLCELPRSADKLTQWDASDPPLSTLRLISLSPSLYSPSSVLTYLFAICSDWRNSIETSLLTVPSSTPHQEHHQYPPYSYSSSQIQQFLFAHSLDIGVTTLPVATLPSLHSLQSPHCSSNLWSWLLQSDPTWHIMSLGAEGVIPGR